MNTTVQALQALYVKLGGSLTDTYDSIADGATVADYATVPDMVDAIAQISKAENLINSVSNDDNGKILTVVDGAAEFAEPETNTFVVNYAEDEDENISCDKTAAEIYAAYESGKTITAQLTGVSGVTTVMHIFAIESISGHNLIGFSAVGELGEPGTELFGINVLHLDDDNDNDQVILDKVGLANEQDVRNVADCIVSYRYQAGNISTHDSYLLGMFTALQGTNTIRAVLDGMQDANGEDYFALQSYSNVADNDPESGDITSVTHTVIFASFIPTVAGVKMRFITQTVVTNAPTYEEFDIVSQSATYEEKDIPITP